MSTEPLQLNTTGFSPETVSLLMSELEQGLAQGHAARKEADGYVGS